MLVSLLPMRCFMLPMHASSLFPPAYVGSPGRVSLCAALPHCTTHPRRCVPKPPGALAHNSWRPCLRRHHCPLRARDKGFRCNGLPSGPSMRIYVSLVLHDWHYHRATCYGGTPKASTHVGKAPIPLALMGSNHAVSSVERLGIVHLTSTTG